MIKQLCMTTSLVILLIIATTIWLAYCYFERQYVAYVPVEYRLCLDGVADSDGYEPDAELDYISTEITIKGTRFIMTDYYCTHLGSLHVKHIGYMCRNTVYFDDIPTFELEKKDDDVICKCANGKTFVLYKE